MQRVERVLDLVARRDVAAHAERRAAELASPSRGRRRLVDVGEHHRGALGDVAPGDRPADAAAGAGHQRHLPLESSHDRLHSLSARPSGAALQNLQERAVAARRRGSPARGPARLAARDRRRARRRPASTPSPTCPTRACAASIAALERRASRVRTLTREEECIGYACGYAAAGGRTAVLMQCSGLGNALNALGSFAIPYAIGIPLVLSMRGTLGEENPAQVPMGRATVGAARRARHPVLPRQRARRRPARRCAACSPRRSPRARPAPSSSSRSWEVSVRAADAVAAAVDAAPDALFVSSLGTATSALRLASGDGPHLYLGGAMGCGLAAALGVADCRPERERRRDRRRRRAADGRELALDALGARPANLLRAACSTTAATRSPAGRSSSAARRSAAVAGSFPGVSARRGRRRRSASATRCGRSRVPASCSPAIDEHAWPGPSPFVDPHTSPYASSPGTPRALG